MQENSQSKRDPGMGLTGIIKEVGILGIMSQEIIVSSFLKITTDR
jgi:hypothetical protein